ncbi:MAG TPA: tetratricopeptide repeat protein [Verrucomicrobiae bacterium]|nr:tetratricopeptide repeat protein [Verrucomicrobiae bacterium]
MVTIKKPVAPFSALTLTILGLVLFNGCAEPGPAALLQGERLLREGNYARAIQKLEQAARLLPRDARAWNHLGLAYHGARRSEDAVKAYQQALALDRNLAAAHYNLGCLHLEQNNVAAAQAEFTSYTGLRPNAFDGWTKLGTAQLRARQLDAAEKNFRQAVKLNPRSAEAWNGLGLVQTQRRRYQEACQQFNAALRAQPEYAPALLNAAIVSHQYLNGRALALQKYQEYLALQPQSPNSAGVRQIVNQLELELRPPARQVPANPPPQAASLPQPAPAAPTTNKPTPNASANKSLAASSTQSAAAPPPRTNPVTSATPTHVVAATSPPPAKSESPPAPPPKVEVVRLTEEEPIRPARDAESNSESRSPSTTSRKPAVTNAAPDSTSASAGSDSTRQKNGFTARLNPRNWFRPKEKPASPSLIDRYKYHSPALPKPGNRAEAERLLTQGVQAQERNRLGEAIEAYRQAAKTDPTFFDAHYNRGVAAYEAGDLPQCLLAYECALAINPVSLKARFNFAVALQKANYPRDAADELEKLLANNPSEARAHFALANLYAQQLDQPAKARDHYLRLLELEPQHPQATAVRYWLEANP